MTLSFLLNVDGRALKRAKAYTNLEDTRPTVRNKPSGLKSDWYRTVVTSPSTSHHRMLASHTRSSSLSASTPTSTSSSIPPSPLLDSDQAMSLIAVSPPSTVSKQFMPPFYGDLVLLVDRKAAERQGHMQPDVVCIYLYTSCAH